LSTVDDSGRIKTNKMQRTLRSKHLRAALWFDAKGKCKICNKELDPDNWHADHIIPWSKTHRTNVHEMQALCPDCNLKKGDKSMDLSAYRPGQFKAHRTIIRRVTEGEKYTSVVLPTRYGKSDVMRCTAIELFREKIISVAVVLTPNTFLRDQMVDPAKINDMVDRYEINGADLTYGSIKQIIKPNKNGEFFLSSTIQLCDQNTQTFKSWVESECSKTNKPPIFYVDEAHTGSESNNWGNTIKSMADSGAFVVLLTATATRSDGKKIPGFDFEVIEREFCKRSVVRDSFEKDGKDFNIIDRLKGVTQKLKLIPNHETTYKKTWEEKPSPLCTISKPSFDLCLNEMQDVEDDENKNKLLSELSETAIRSKLGRMLKDKVVIRYGVEMLLGEIDVFRKHYKKAASIIFCGNDDDAKKKINDHAKRIRCAIEERAPHLSVVIATSAEGDDGGKKIKDFAHGVGDILIVKQMASLGLDVPRLKLCLDLSPIRTVAAYIQRMMRIATPVEWVDPAAGVKRIVNKCVYICPDDIIGRNLFKDLISDEGGESTTTVLELIDTVIREAGDKLEDPKYAVISGKPGSIEDSDSNKGEAEDYESVLALLHHYPELAVLTHAKVIKLVSELKDGIIFNKAPYPINTTEVAGDLKESINSIAKDITMQRLGGGYSPNNAWRYGETIKSVFRECYSTLGLSKGQDNLDSCSIEELKKIKSKMEATYR